MKKQYAVFGLGNFGSSVALKLQALGCDVVVVDSSMEKINDIADEVSYAIKADIEEPDVMKSLGARNLDGAIVAISDHMEASIMATIMAKELGIPYVIAKAKSELHAKILKKVGADTIVYPEKEMGNKIAKSLVSTNFADWIELSPDYSLVEMKIPKAWSGKSLIELNVREQYGMNVVGIVEGAKTEVTIDPKKPLPENCKVILIGEDSQLKNLKSE